MVKQQYKQILFDLMNGLLGPKTEEEILNKNIPIFVKKLNCFMASTVKIQDYKINIKYMTPYVFNKNILWHKVINVCKNYETSKKEIEKFGSYHFEIDGKYFYKFRIEEYGFLILGKNTPFENIFRYELATVINFLSKSLSLAIERKRLKESEKKISEERNLFKTIIDNIPIHIYAKNKKLERILSNKVELEYIGKNSEDEVYGKIDSELFPFFKPEWETSDIKVLEGATILNEEGIFGDKSQWFLRSKIPLKNLNDKITGLVGILINITSQKNLEKELTIALEESHIASNAKEQFLANMSHEIRTPLNIITGMLRELKKGKITDVQRKLLESTNLAAKHLLSIVNNILDISKIEAGEFKVEFQPFNLGKLLNEIGILIKNDLKVQKTKFEIVFDENIAPALIGDKTHVLQILLNIISNAIKFTKKGKISLECTLKKDTEYDQIINFEIIDNGIGMSKEYLKDFFKKFHQEDFSKTKKYGGTGLGMHITYELISLMNGSISVDSVKNEGTKICFQLPFKKGNKNTIKNNSELDYDSFDEQISILLVDDNEMNRLVANNTLKIINADVTEAENGLEAVNLIKEHNFDVILMDLQMPIMNGIDATKLIRKELKLQIPIIALTANALRSEIENCFNIGMNDYITKPFEEDIFIKKILKNHSSYKRYNEVNRFLKKKKKESNLEELYNLEKLKKMSVGDLEFEKKMMQIFIKSSKENIILFKNHLEDFDISAIKKLVHKMKPSIKNLMIHSIEKEINNIEKIGDKIPKEELESMVIKIVTDLAEVTKKLEAKI